MDKTFYLTGATPNSAWGWLNLCAVRSFPPRLGEKRGLKTFLHIPRRLFAVPLFLWNRL